MSMAPANYAENQATFHYNAKWLAVSCGVVCGSRGQALQAFKVLACVPDPMPSHNHYGPPEWGACSGHMIKGGGLRCTAAG
jgi:hypothetical protein